MLKPLAPVGPPGDSHIAASLTQHLLSQNAPRAAARVSGHEPTQPEPCAYAVAPDSVTLVDTAALAACFSGMLHELLHAPATVGLDLALSAPGGRFRLSQRQRLKHDIR